MTAPAILQRCDRRRRSVRAEQCNRVGKGRQLIARRVENELASDDMLRRGADLAIYENEKSEECNN